VKRAYIVLLACLVGTAACSGSARAIESGETMPQGADPAAAQVAEAPPQTTGKVIENIDAGRYTYIKVDYGEKKIWAAAPHFEVTVGDKAVVPSGVAMMEYHSKILDRTFDVVYFVASVAVTGEGGEALVPSGHGDALRGTPTVATDLSGIERAEGGKTVGEIFDGKANLAGQEVSVRGRVIKLTPKVMGKNWIHLQDGTTGAGAPPHLSDPPPHMGAGGDTVVVRGGVAGAPATCAAAGSAP
jgi:hypothetical protein